MYGKGSLLTLSFACTTAVRPPTAPIGVTAEASIGRAIVMWSQPEHDGGAPITAYEITSADGSIPAKRVEATIKQTSIPNLVNGHTYTFCVKGENSIGLGPAGASAPVQPSGPPAPPQSVAARALPDGSIEVTWAPPVSNGGQRIEEYSIAPLGGGRPSLSTPSGTHQALYRKLPRGASARFTVVAINRLGRSQPSDASEEVTSVAVPGAPSKVVGKWEGGEVVTVSWDAPADSGGAPITGYTVVGMPAGHAEVAGDATTVEVKQLLADHE